MHDAVTDPHKNPAFTPASTDKSSQAPASIRLSRAKEHQAAETTAGRDPHSVRNFFVLALYQIVMRTGWIFKTESVIIPAVLDTLGGGAWLRGCLPLINRFGQSVPPMLLARRVKIAPRKLRVLSVTSSCMAAAFLGLAAIWFFSAQLMWWTPAAFLALYAVFFMSVGVNNMTFGSLQGKLVKATSRGRLLMVASPVGAVTSVTAAALLLPMWLRADQGDFHWIFGFSGICFAIGAASIWLLRERRDNFQQPSTGVWRVFRGAAGVLKKDANFRRLAMVSALFGCSMILFPHYQALALQEDHRLDRLIGWVIVQNIGTGLFSLVIGPLADFRGNRLVLRLLLLGVTLAPVSALLLSGFGQTGQTLFPFVFLLVGMTPVTIRALQNYTLEIASPADHPKYLSTLSFCMAAPIFLSPLAGIAIDVYGFAAVFVTICAFVMFGWLLTFWLEEPRKWIAHPVSEPPIGEDG